MNIRAKRESPFRNAAAVAAAKRRFLKIERSSIGAAERASIRMKSGISRAPTIRLPITSESFQPLIPPREIP